MSTINLDFIFGKKADESSFFFTTYARVALYLILKSILFKKKEVLIPAFTCPVAVTEVIKKAGGIPVFVDVDLCTLNFNIKDLESKISDATAAVISHHYFGMVNTQTDINDKIAKKYGLIHIEDCAHSLGAEFGGYPIGKNCHAAVYSFTKNISCSGGGVLKINKKIDLLEKTSELYNFIKSKKTETLIMNFDFFHYFYQLLIIEKYIKYGNNLLISDLILNKIPYIWHLPKKLVKYVSGINDYQGNFYNMDSDRSLKPVEFDLKMTNFQKKIINKQMLLFHRIIKKRRETAQTIDKIIPHPYFETKKCFFVHSNYPIVTHDKKKVLYLSKKANICINETWPSEGRYENIQKTENIKWLEQNMLLLPISPGWQKKHIEKIEFFLFKHKKLFYNPFQAEKNYA